MTAFSGLACMRARDGASARMVTIVAVLAGGLACQTPAAAIAEIYSEQQGEVTLEASCYPREAAYARQTDIFSHFEARPELYLEADSATFLLQPRLSGGSAGHGSADLREAHVTTRLGDADILFGSTILFWGQTESYNPVDVVNSRDFSRGLMRGEKRGAPMLRVSWPVGPGQVDLLAIDFVPNIYPGAALRERPGLPVRRQHRFSHGAKKDDLATALRWSGFFGDVDLGLSWFRGTGVNPRLLPQADGTLQPDYSRITQTGVDVLYLRGDSAVKGEFVRRSGQYDLNGTVKSYRAAVLGIEHNIYDVDGSGRDLVLIAEIARDSRKATAHSGFQNDLAVGARLLFNDVEDSEAMLLVSRDLDNGAQLVSLTGSRRINDALTADVSAKLPTKFEDDPASAALARDAVLVLSLTYGF